MERFFYQWTATLLLLSKNDNIVDISKQEVTDEDAKDRAVDLCKAHRCLISTGPVQPSYRNFSKLGKGRYHCHLSYHWVACRECHNGEYIIEVYYVGSRESAPY